MQPRHTLGAIRSEGYPDAFADVSGADALGFGATRSVERDLYSSRIV